MQLDWIETGLKKPGKSQRGLAKVLHIDPSNVSRLLSGERQLKAAEISKIEQYLGEEAPAELARAVLPLIRPTRRLSLTEVGVKAAGGGGAVVEREEIVSHWEIPELWIRNITDAGERDLHVITVEGNSMEPELRPGDKIIVDSSRKSPTPPGIFVLYDGIGTVVKQLEHIPKTNPPRVEIKSANKDYRADEATADEINIIGRVIGVIRRV